MESIVSKVEQLIYNLIGMPAGLKLNRPLNTALGNFFLYHIHIWKAYITLIRPFLSLVLDLLGLISFFGITFVLSFFSDLISLASIHIYCFYGYAARLYCFQLSGLISLWRLFRGKKWNNLKHRVDSYSYGHDQLFIGTVCFTILIFLLPTILLYYIVFLFLRLISIISQFFIKLVIGIILLIPFYGLFLWICGSAQIKTNLFFQIVEITKERQLTVNMIFKSMTLGQIFNSHTCNSGNPFNYHKLLPDNFFLSILTGSLI
ncbi:phosphatidylinositol N-acetylglucosaminyltransferase subunit Q-like [Panonychus citri]|nr:phosphatidylinositol N-acetylglucosaminyltransferase subunit Q-like [Panonychus citri]XP_053204008.1 phosphatidylinositol N-acetylglucosaminyltransferase subunit Q-like [Panonychus citri]